MCFKLLLIEISYVNQVTQQEIPDVPLDAGGQFVA